MPTLRDKTWTWGYVIPGTPPGDVPFVGKSSCSLETAAAYIGTPNVVFMNSNHWQDRLNPEHLDRLSGCRQVLCGLQHGAYAETARRVSQLSKTYGNIGGGLIDDFLEFHGPSGSMNPESTRAVYEALKSENSALRLYVVHYTWQDHTLLLPHLPYFDVINLWVWVANRHTWEVTMNEFEIEKLTRLTGKPVLLGLFMHDYGGTGGPVPLDIMELQFRKAVALAKAGTIEGFVVLQSGWFDREDHRPQVQWMKQYLDWAFGTATTREA